MTTSEAKKVLLLYRPGTADANDAEVAEALAMVHNDAELRAWFEQHCALQLKVRRELRALPVPEPNLRPLPRGVVAGPAAWWHKPGVLAAAAALVVVALSLWATFKSPPVPDRFQDYRARMVRTVLREYRMDVVTDDMSRLRDFVSKKGAPSDYQVPEGLKPLALTGGGVLTWRGAPVSMVCFDRGNQQMAFLFIVDRARVPDPPPARPQFSQVNKLTTASWTEGDKAYLLAAETDSEALRKYLQK